MRILKISYFVIGFISLIILFIGIGIAAYGSIYNIPDSDPIVGIFKLIIVVGICIGLLWAFLLFLYVIIDEYVINP
jgi:hypothetical protein